MWIDEEQCQPVFDRQGTTAVPKLATRRRSFGGDCRRISIRPKEGRFLLSSGTCAVKIIISAWHTTVCVNQLLCLGDSNVSVWGGAVWRFLLVHCISGQNMLKNMTKQMGLEGKKRKNHDFFGHALIMMINIIAVLLELGVGIFIFFPNLSLCTLRERLTRFVYSPSFTSSAVPPVWS